MRRLLWTACLALLIAAAPAAAQTSVTSPTFGTATAAKFQVSALSTPAAPTVSPQGTTGATTYSYKIVAVNAFGVTVASSAGTTATGNASLSSTNFNRVTWAGVNGATAYRVYGRTSGSELLMATVSGALLRFDDTGAVTPSGALPGANTTLGATCTAVDTSVLVVDCTNDRVGIGDATPASLFSVGSGDLFQIDTSGRAFLPAGASGAGNLSVSFTGDTNTGFYRNDADNITIQTGGADRVTVDENGNVGIGTTTPATRLDVQTTDATNRVIGRFERTASYDTNFLIKNSVAADSRAVGVVLSVKNAAGTQSNVSIDATSQTGQNAGLFIRTGGSDETVGTTKMTVTGAGNVGIGTTAPGQKLDVNGAIALGGNSGSANNLAWSGAAPTISSGFGTSPSVVHGTSASFLLNVGTGGSATSGVIGLPTAANGWTVHCQNLSSNTATVFITKQTASSTTTATIGNYDAAGAAAAWAASDTLACTATAR